MDNDYCWSLDKNGTMTIWEGNAVLATVENCNGRCVDCSDCSLEALFKDVVYELKGVDLDAYTWNDDQGSSRGMGA